MTLSRFFYSLFIVDNSSYLLASTCRAIPFSALFGVDIVVKNKSMCVLSGSVLLSTTTTHHYSFPKHFSFWILREFAKGFERKVWHVQVAHLHNAARALSSLSRCFQLSTNLDRDFFRYLWYCGKKNRMLFSVALVKFHWFGIMH